MRVCTRLGRSPVGIYVWPGVPSNTLITQLMRVLVCVYFVHAWITTVRVN